MDVTKGETQNDCTLNGGARLERTSNRRGPTEGATLIPRAWRGSRTIKISTSGKPGTGAERIEKVTYSIRIGRISIKKGRPRAGKPSRKVENRARVSLKKIDLNLEGGRSKNCTLYCASSRMTTSSFTRAEISPVSQPATTGKVTKSAPRRKGS